MTYTIPGLTAGASYTVRLHMSEYTDPGVGQREYNVAIFEDECYADLLWQGVRGRREGRG